MDGKEGKKGGRKINGVGLISKTDYSQNRKLTYSLLFLYSATKVSRYSIFHAIPKCKDSTISQSNYPATGSDENFEH